jgi:hypothetical protein
LGIVVGALAVLIGGWMLFGYVNSQFSKRQQQIDTLESQIATARRQIQAGKMAVRSIGEFESRSLPANAEVARSLYHDWLLARIGEAGLIDQDVRAVGSIAEKNLYVQQSFNVKAKGTLPQVVDFLHTFYSVDWVHRMSFLKLKPVPETKLMDIDLKIDALSLLRAESEAKLVERPSQRLKLDSRAAYQAVISGRNLFGPPNQPPRLTINGSKEANTNRQMELTARATDADVLDKVQYELVESATKDARFDPATGRLTWTPRATGKFEFKFRAKDDGLPNKISDVVAVVVEVTDPLPPEPPAPRKLAFDQAKFTVLTAVLEIGGTAEVWLHVRPTGETLKLHAGEEFEVGSVKGVVEEIGESHFTFVSDDSLRRLDKGEVLEDSQATVEAGEPPALSSGEPISSDLSAP